jgi:3-carboxy-cis,cis-muconate cycloisomerase
MPFSPADSRITGVLFSDPELAAIYADEAAVAAMLRVESALAAAQGRLGVIPPAAAEAIVAAAKTVTIDYDALAAGTERAGVPVIDLVRQLRAASGEAADYVHWGATTQDILDTATVLQARGALAALESRLDRLIANLAALAGQHRTTLMAGRTHSQQALPIPFGLKVANWLAPLLRHRDRLAQLRPRLLVVQFGGAAGTLAALGDDGPAVQRALAEALGLGVAPTPWHTQRDTLAEVAGWLSLLTGSLGKMAQDIILLAQSEVAEVRESADPGRGGSSTMPQKANPIISEVIIAAARSNAALLGSMHQAQIQEHERGTHGWQMEWLALPQMMGLTGAALAKALFLSENLVVDTARMAATVEASRGVMLAEALTFALAPALGRAEAKRLVGEAIAQATADDRHLIDVARETTDVPLDWDALADATTYFGSADLFISQVLASV